MKSLWKNIRASICLLVVFTFLLGGIYPASIYVISQIGFSHASSGALLKQDGKIIGSELLGQEFTKPGYFWGRLSSTEPPYNAADSASSNLSAANPELQKKINARVAQLKKYDPTTTRIPIDLVTSSASGLDPHISFASALYQVPRVAKFRKMKKSDLMNLVHQFKESPLLGFLGEEKINVLRLNIALDDLIKVHKKEKR